MIKRLIGNALWGVGKFWSHVYSKKASDRLSRMKEILFSAWISREFFSFGKSSRISSLSRFKGGKYISIGNRCSLGKRIVLTAWGTPRPDSDARQIVIGDHVSIGDDSHITAINRVEIGNHVLTGKKITITDNAHGRSHYESLALPPTERPLHSEGPVVIEDGVWLGDKVTVLPNVRIGRNSIIGANAVVTKDIPANCVAGGIPARVIKQLA